MCRTEESRQRLHEGFPSVESDPLDTDIEGEARAEPTRLGNEVVAPLVEDEGCSTQDLPRELAQGEDGPGPAKRHHRRRCCSCRLFCGVVTAILLLGMLGDYRSWMQGRPPLLPHLVSGVYGLIFLSEVFGLNENYGGASTFFDGLNLPIRMLALFEVSGPRTTHLDYAHEYHKEQRPHVLLSAAALKMNSYFAHTKVVPRLTCSLASCWSFNTMLTARARAMAAQLGTRDDFKVEKEKCVMMRFLAANNLSHAPVLGTWYDQAEFLHAVAGLYLPSATVNASASRGSTAGSTPSRTPWPLFVKACHLTTGGANSVARWRGAAWVEEHELEIEEWVREKWDYDEHDGRQWRDFHKALVSTLRPGFMLQAAANVSFKRGGDPVEFKVEVIWGRAMLANLDGSGWKLLVTRAPEGNPGAGVRFEAFSDTLLTQPVAPDPWWDWLRDEGHFELCVWPLAEALARAGGMDEVRVDIFVGPRGAPHGCMVNEISLTSGSKNAMHGLYMAHLWSEVHVSGAHGTCGKSGQKVYDRNECGP